MYKTRDRVLSDHLYNMTNFITILLIIVLLLLLYVLYRYYSTSGSIPLTSLADATVTQTIQAASLGSGTGVASNNFSYSIWFYLNDWNYRYGEPKVILGRVNNTNISDGLDSVGPCPLISWTPISNNIEIAMSVYPGPGSGSGISSGPVSDIIDIHTTMLPNVPIQRWVNLLMSVYGRTMDIYLDGKLVKTNVLPGVAKINNADNLFVTPGGGFSGSTANLQYFNTATDPQTAWNIYKSGYGSSSVFSNYQLKLTVVNNGTDTTSLTI